MKTLKSLLYVFLAAFLFVGCNDDENFNPGEPEDPDCYSVYFPTQENIGSKELDPAAPTEMTFTVRRLKSEGAIVVPVAVTSSEEGIFVPSQIEFADGQEETTFSIQFPQAEIGTTYKCEVNIEDKKYASVYGEKATGFAFSVTRVKWNKLTGKGGETKGKWRDDIISTLFNTANPNAEVDVEIYERADKPGYYRMNPFTQDLIRALFNGTAQACTEPNIIIDATNPDAVWIPYQTTGVTLGGDGEIEIASKVNANFSSVSESASLYGTLKDGIITFPATGIMVNFTVSGGWYGANGSGLQRIMLPGAKAYDYTLALTNTEPAAGVVKVGFKFGADVAKVKYAFFNGSMSDALADVRSGEIESGGVPECGYPFGKNRTFLGKRGVGLYPREFDQGDPVRTEYPVGLLGFVQDFRPGRPEHGTVGTGCQILGRCVHGRRTREDQRQRVFGCVPRGPEQRYELYAPGFGFQRVFLQGLCRRADYRR